MSSSTNRAFDPDIVHEAFSKYFGCNEGNLNKWKVVLIAYEVSGTHDLRQMVSDDGLLAW